MPKISVIMPIFNTDEKILRKAIESILNQTYQDFEFLILNDSPQNTDLDKLVKSYKDSRIRYFKSKKNLGIANSHNYLLSLATGRYIALMDHDDISLPKRLEKQLTYMEKHPKVGICGCAYKRFGKIWKKRVIRHPSDNDMICAYLFFKCPIHHPSVMMQKSILDKYKITYEHQFISLNDRQLYLDISRHARLHNLNDVLYKYRIHTYMTSKLRRKEITNEQLLYRRRFLNRYHIHLNPRETKIMNEYLLNGRNKIKNEHILYEINALLKKFIQENKKKHFADEKAFRKVCADYLIKRCKNACLNGFISSNRILKENSIFEGVPLWLRMFNFIKRRNL